MKLQINSLEALERLIGGDSEVELEIRNNIVQEFTKKHLKALVNEGSIQKVANAIDKRLRDKAEEIIVDKFGIESGNYWNSKFTLNDTAKAALNDAADSAFRSHIIRLFAETERRMAERYSEQYISEQITRVVDANVNKRIAEGVKERLDAIKNSI
jgi:hypothetical protein